MGFNCVALNAISLEQLDDRKIEMLCEAALSQDHMPVVCSEISETPEERFCSCENVRIVDITSLFPYGCARSSREESSVRLYLDLSTTSHFAKLEASPLNDKKSRGPASSAAPAS